MFGCGLGWFGGGLTYGKSMFGCGLGWFGGGLGWFGGVLGGLGVFQWTHKIVHRHTFATNTVSSPTGLKTVDLTNLARFPRYALKVNSDPV